MPWRGALAVVLLAGGVIGSIVWVAALSPYGFIRFSLLHADRTVTVSRPGEFLLFEEYPGAASADLPSPLAVTVTDDRGRPVPVEVLLDPGDEGAPYSYRVPPHEGRAVARFDATRPGLYLVQVEPLNLGALDRSDYRPRLPEGLAVGRRIEWNWLRGPLGLLVCGVLPLVAGTVVAVWAVRRRRRIRADAANEVHQPVR